MRKTLLVLSATVAMLATAGMAQAADCDITVGLVMELTGPAGEYGQAGAKSVEMAFRDINDAGGVARLQARHRHARFSQSQGNVAVDAATQLVQVKKVPVDHRRHHLVGVDPDPDLGHGAGQASCRSRPPPPRRR